MSNERILIIEDDLIVSKFLSKAIETQNYIVDKANNGYFGLSKAINLFPDLIILDLGLPDIDGVKLIKEIHSHKNIPIIVISARSKEDDIIGALDEGAIDYIKKPFNIDEVMARIRVALRITKNHSVEEIFEFKDLYIDNNKKIVMINNLEIHLTSTEYKILLFLIENQGKLVTLYNIQQHVWGYSTLDNYGSLRVFINSIRKKLGESPINKYIVTEVGVGYRFLDK